MHGGRPHGVFEVVPKDITRHVPPDPDPGNNILLELSPNHDHSNGASDRCAENADTAVPDPESSYQSISNRKGGRYRCGSIEKLLGVVFNSRESGHGRVNHRNKAERSESSRIQQLKVGQRNKAEWIRPYPAPQEENHPMLSIQRRVNAIHRVSGDNRASLRSIVLRILSNKARQEHRQPYLGPQAETTALPMHTRRVPARGKGSGPTYARGRSVACVKKHEGNRANIGVSNYLSEYTMACARK